MKTLLQPSNTSVASRKRSNAVNRLTALEERLAMRSTAPSKQTIVQPKLELTTPGDSYEQEADRMANFVMRKQDGGGMPVEMPSTTSAFPPVISRRTHGAISGIAVDTATKSGINASRGGGHSMPSALRTKMESGFGADFSGVRLHTGSRAADLSGNLQAKAFTYGHDIFFNSGQYQPHTSQGQHLIAHELTHVVQQSGKVGRIPEDNMSVSPELLMSKMPDKSLSPKQETPSMEFDPEDFCGSFKDVNTFDLLEAALVKLPTIQRKALIYYLKDKNLGKVNLPMIYHQSTFMDSNLMARVLTYLVENDVIQDGKAITPSTVCNLIYLFEIGYENAINTYIDTMAKNNVIADMKAFVEFNAPWLNSSHIQVITLMLKEKLNHRYETEQFMARDGSIFRASDIPSMKRRIILDNFSKINHGIVTTVLGGGYMLVKSINGEQVDQSRLNAWLTLGNNIDDYLSNKSDVREMRITNSKIGAPMDTGYSALSKGNQAAIHGINNPKSSNSTNKGSKLTPLNDAQLQKVGIQKYDYFNNLTITDR